MNAEERLTLIATLRRGYCTHENRVNICVECRTALEKIINSVKE